MAKKLAARPAGTTGTKCCCDPAIITECRKRSGMAQLCGWEEYVSSAPAKRYTHRQLSGALRRDSYYDSPCTGGLENCTIFTFSGVAIKTQGALCSVTQQASFVISYCSGAAFPYSVDEATVAGSVASLTATTRTLTWPTECVGVNGYPPGAIVSTLSNEDTETMAEARVTTTWGEWSGIGSCPSCCVASRGDREGSVIVWNFTASQFRLGIEEGPVDELYTVALDYMRREIGDTEWIKVATDYFSVVSTEPEASRDGWPAYPVPQLAGYETTIDNIRIYHPDE